MLEFDDVPGTGQPIIKVIGVGGGGGNSVNTMIEAGVQGVDFIAANTDCQVLQTNLAPTKIQIGRGLTKGLGAGANPEIGAAAALEDSARLAEVLEGAEMVFVTAGMGGGTGTGAAPIIAQVARDMGALTVGVVTKPFDFEGGQRRRRAGAGVAALAKAVDALIVIPNDRLVGLAGMKTTLKDAFALVDNVCLNAVRGISDLVVVPGLVNVDFADVRTVMTGMGRALMGTGRARGEHRAVEAAKLAINSPLLEDVSINGATGILVNVTAGPDLTLNEIREACALINDAADSDANIIFGSVIEANAGDELRVTVIATGFQSSAIAEVSPSIAVASSGRSSSSMSVRRNAHDNQMALPMASRPAAVVETQPTQPLGSGRVFTEHNDFPDLVSIDTPAPVAVAPNAPAYGGGYAPSNVHNAYAPSGAVTPMPLVPAPGAPAPTAPHVYSATPAPSSVPFTAPFPPATVYAPPAVGQAAPPSQAPSQPMVASPGSVPTDWNPPSDSRPIIRPPVSSPLAAGMTPPSRWTPSYATPVLQHEDLGLGDSELDKPAFIRKRFTQEHAVAATPGYARLPGERE